MTNKPAITYFLRNPKAGISMHRVFLPIARNIDACNYIEAPTHRANLIGIIRNMTWAFTHRNKHGINHITGDIHYIALAMPHCKKVLTIHDLVTLRIDGNPIKRCILRKLWFEWPLRHCDIVTCISENTRTQLLQNFKINPQRIIVIPNPLNPDYTYTPKTFNEHCPQILHVGTGWNKNLIRVAQALKDITCRLVIVGKLSHEQHTALHNCKIDYRNEVNISDQQLLKEYHDCDILSFPSLFEGFGMPVIEGQAVGRCVLTSNRPPMDGIAGQGACLVTPDSTQSIRQGFQRIIQNSNYRQQLINNAQQNILRFQLTHICQQYKEIYQYT